jgi:nucleoside permease NupC
MKRLILPSPGLPDVTRRFGGRSFVVGFYALVVAITGVVGAVLGAVGPEDLTAVRLLGVVELQPTPLGLAIYGVVTAGLALGVPLLLVAYVSRRVDAEQAE